MRLAIITTHPIQYYAPVFELLSKRKVIDVKVFYTWGENALKKIDPGFEREIVWDIPLLKGYEFEWIRNVADNPGSHHFNGIVNPDLIDRITIWKPDAILVIGWSYKSHLNAIRHFFKKKAVYFRGDSTLIDEKLGARGILKLFFLKWVYSYVDHAFYVGSLSRSYFLKYGFKEKQLTFAPHAIDNDRFGIDRSIETLELKKRLNISTEDLIILFAGKLEEKKAPLELLHAFLDLKLECDKHLLFVGNGHLENKLKFIAANHPNVHFLHFQNQHMMPVIYQAADLFCLPSKGPGETWGLAVNEAMACSKAILVSDKCGCSADLVKDHYNGRIFKSGDKNALMKCLQELTTSRENLKILGARSATIIREWNFTTIAESIETKTISSQVSTNG